MMLSYVQTHSHSCPWFDLPKIHWNVFPQIPETHGITGASLWKMRKHIPEYFWQIKPWARMAMGVYITQRPPFIFLENL